MTQGARERLPAAWQASVDHDFWWAERFGWPPQVVDAMPARRAMRLKAATIALDEGRELARKAEADRRSS
jgi:hypothetical protein